MTETLTAPARVAYAPGMETVACLCGAATPASRAIQACDEIGGETFTYLACPDCSLERLSPRPTQDRIGAYYPATYVPHVDYGPPGRADRLKRLVYEVFWAPPEERPEGVRRWHALLRLALFPIRHRTVLAFAPPSLRRVFEFGAAKGTDLLAFRAAGWDAQGCEPSAQACALAATRGLLLQQATAEEAALEPGAYGCILFNNVFEHVHDPVAILHKCATALVPGGVLMLIVPNHRSLSAALFGAAWPGYDAPRHIWGWTPASITAELRKAGFDLEGIRHQATGSWLWSSILDRRHAPDRPGPLASWLARKAPWVGVPLGVAAAWLGRGDFIRRRGPPARRGLSADRRCPYHRATARSSVTWRSAVWRRCSEAAASSGATWSSGWPPPGTWCASPGAIRSVPRT